MVELEKQILKIGQEVRLKSYSPFSDYRNHKDQKCRITELYPGVDLSIIVKWVDGVESSVSHNNIMLVVGDWDE